MRDAWRLPLICHKDGKHVMIANAEQIGLGKQAEERAWGAETDGIVGPVPAIPTHDGAGKPPLLQSDTCCWCLHASSTCANTRGADNVPVILSTIVNGEHFLAFIYIIVLFF